MYSAEGSRSRIKQILLNPQSDNSDCFTLISVLWGETVENHLLQLLQTIHDFQRLGHRHALLGWRPLWTGSFPMLPFPCPSPTAAFPRGHRLSSPWQQKVPLFVLRLPFPGFCSSLPNRCVSVMPKVNTGQRDSGGRGDRWR